ncbi:MULTISPECIES: glycosyl hydrolase [Actinoplanes]|uniref:glycoside hydrolase family 26 protein n=1 Tax=Actinoplanes TaxID=1865 RepID=UPI000698544D|nr:MULTISPECIES: glycosyl hydrolase [Actinoplanes]GLY06350.1 hypothetical protein Acsp01_67290 [Actinoplanes sp. NBRC 101535]
MTTPARKAWIASAAVVVVALGVGVAALTGKDDERPVAATPSASVSVAAPVPVATDSASLRSARTRIALPKAAGTWPGDHGLSGVNGFPTLNTKSVTEFCTARGRGCTVAHTYTDRTSYESMTRGSAWTFEYFADFDGVLVISQALVPDKGENLVAGCAAGEYDAYWRDFGTLMVKQNRGDSVLRLGWEMNEATMAWRGLNAANYINCYRHAATAIRSTNPQVVLDWTINAHNSPADLCGGLSTTCYPGDDYVDIIGIDNYDHHPWSPTRQDFERTADAQEGLDWLHDFARARGKLFSVGEWGVVPTGDAGKENPDFITWMHDWFAAHADTLAYEMYFQRCDGTVNQSAILRPNDRNCLPNTASSNVYRELWGS